MPDPITDTQLAEWERLAEAAFPAEWWSDGWLLFIPDEPGGNESGKRMIDVSGLIDEHPQVTDKESEQIEADAKFIAAARTAVPALVAEVRRLRTAMLPVLSILARPSATAAEPHDSFGKWGCPLRPSEIRAMQACLGIGSKQCTINR